MRNQLMQIEIAAYRNSKKFENWLSKDWYYKSSGSTEQKMDK